MSRRLAIVDSDLCVGCQSCMFACARRHKHSGLASCRLHVRSAGGMRNGFIIVVCRACPDPPCARVCPTDALTLREGGGVDLHEERCIGCGHCVEACPYGAVFFDEGRAKPEICIHCGYCVEYCPHGVLELEDAHAAR